MKNIKFLPGGLVLLLSGLFFIGSADIVPTRSFSILWNLGHIVFFTIAVFLLLRFTPLLQKKSQASQVYWVIGLCLIASILIETIQFFIGRQPDWADVFRNILGGLIALVFFPQPCLNQNSLFDFRFKLIIIALLCSQLLPLMLALVDEQTARNEFPVLANFESELELSRWHSDGSITFDKGIKINGDSSARIELTTDEYSGASLDYLPGNWRGYNQVLFSIYLPNHPTLSLNIRIHDQQHEQSGYLYNDRFNKIANLQVGWNHITIDMNEVVHAPQTRIMDIESITNIHFFASNLAQPRLIYLDNLRLE